MDTCQNMTCEEACCSAKELRDFGIFHPDECCKFEFHKTHQKRMKDFVAPFKHLSGLNISEEYTPHIHNPVKTDNAVPHTHQHDFPQPRADLASTSQEFFDSNQDSELGVTGNETQYGVTQFHLIVSCFSSFLVVILLIVATYFAWKWRSKYLKSIRSNNVIISHTVNSDEIEMGDGSTYHVSRRGSHTSTSTGRYTEMVNINEKVPLPEQAQSNSKATTELPSYQDLFTENRDNVNTEK